MIVDFVIMLMIALAVVAACAYMRYQKKHGGACGGCPYAGSCGKKNQGGCSLDGK